MSEKLAVGKIITTHGLKGAVKIKTFSGEAEHFTRMKEIEIRGSAGTIAARAEWVKITGKAVIMKIEGFDTIEAVQPITGSEVWTTREYCAPLTEGEYYAADLCGCAVTCRGGNCGRVINVVAGTQADLLEIETAGGERRYLPCLDVYIEEIDPVQKRIELRDDWILQ